VPTRLNINSIYEKWAQCTGDCCGEWMIEFRSNYGRDIEALDALAAEAWNAAPRATQAEDANNG